MPNNPDLSDVLVASGVSPVAANAIEAVVSAGQAGNLVVTAGTTGMTSGWIPASVAPLAFVVQSSGITGTASVVVDRSADGLTAFDTVGTVSLTSADNGKAFGVTTPRPVGLPFVRFTVAADGGGTHNVILGA